MTTYFRLIACYRLPREEVGKDKSAIRQGDLMSIFLFGGRAKIRSALKNAEITDD